MINSLQIKNFRSLENFQLNDLSRINLLVGKNNSGKTSILEAIALLQSDINIQQTLDEILAVRYELSGTEKNEFNPVIFFTNFNIIPQKSKIFIKADAQKSSKTLGIFIVLNKDNLGQSIRSSMELSFQWNTTKFITDNQPNTSYIESTFPILNATVKTSEAKYIVPKKSLVFDFQERVTRDEIFVTTNFFLRSNLISLYKRISATNLEKQVIKILQSLEPEIEDLAIGVNDFVVKLTNIDRQIHIGSLGDGIYRLLGLALAMVNVKNGILLVDEIDTGLHYTAMDDMWKMIWQTANDLNVQVFATTHSSDCWKSLAEFAGTFDKPNDGIAIHYIDKKREHSISYSEEEMMIAAEEDYEVRGV
jgi:AAA15 family ATPase/GTPase